MAQTFNQTSSSEDSIDLIYVIDKIPKTVACCLLFLMSVLGNCFILWTIYKDDRLKNTINFLVANMAVSDLLATLVSLPTMVYLINVDLVWLIEGDLGHALCKLVSFLLNISVVVSVYSGVFIAIERFYAVAYPLRRGCLRYRLKYIIPGIWIFSVVITSPYLYYLRVEKCHDIKYCTTPHLRFSSFLKYFYVLITMISGIPALVVTITYILIVYKLHHHKVLGQQTDSFRRRRDQQNKKVLKMSAVIVSSLYLTWVFHGTFVILLYNGRISSKIVDGIEYAVAFITSMSFTYNFFIYLIFIDIYRENFKTMISKLCCTCRKEKSVMQIRAGRAGGRHRVELEVVIMKTFSQHETIECKM